MILLNRNKKRPYFQTVQQANPVIARHNRLLSHIIRQGTGDPTANHYIRLFFAVTVSHLFHGSDCDSGVLNYFFVLVGCLVMIWKKQGVVPVQQQRSCDMTHVACHYHVPNIMV